MRDRRLCSAASFSHAGSAAGPFGQAPAAQAPPCAAGSARETRAVTQRQPDQPDLAARPQRPPPWWGPAPMAGQGHRQGGGLLGCHTRDSARPRRRRGIDSLASELRHRPGWPGWPGSPTRLLARGSRPAGPRQRLGGTQAALGPLTHTQQQQRGCGKGGPIQSSALPQPRSTDRALRRHRRHGRPRQPAQPAQAPRAPGAARAHRPPGPRRIDPPHGSARLRPRASALLRRPLQ